MQQHFSIQSFRQHYRGQTFSRRFTAFHTLLMTVKNCSANALHFSTRVRKPVNSLQKFWTIHWPFSIFLQKADFWWENSPKTIGDLSIGTLQTRDQLMMSVCTECGSCILHFITRVYLSVYICVCALARLTHLSLLLLMLPSVVQQLHRSTIVGGGGTIQFLVDFVYSTTCSRDAVLHLRVHICASYQQTCLR